MLTRIDQSLDKTEPRQYLTPAALDLEIFQEICFRPLSFSATFTPFNINDGGWKRARVKYSSENYLSRKFDQIRRIWVGYVRLLARDDSKRTWINSYRRLEAPCPSTRSPTRFLRILFRFSEWQFHFSGSYVGVSKALDLRVEDEPRITKSPIAECVTRVPSFWMSSWFSFH